MKDQNIFRDKLFSHTTPVSDDLWHKIESQLPARKKRFPFFWLSLGLGSLMAGGAIVWFSLLSPKDHRPDPAPTQEQQQEPGATAVNYGNATGTNEASLYKADASDNNSAITETNSEINSSNANSAPSLIAPTSNTASNKTKPARKTAATVGKTNPTQNKNNFTPSSTSNIDLSAETFTLRNSESIASIPTADVILLTTEDDILDLLKIHPDPSCYKFTGEKSISPLSFDVYAGPGYSPRSFQNAGGELSFYRDARLGTEHHQYAWSLGTRVNYNLHGGYALRAGLEFVQTGDIFDYTDTLATQTTTRIDSFFAADGTFLYSDTSRVIVLGTLIKKIHNRYTNIDVPFIFSYELPMGRSTIMLNAGPVLNLTTSYRGQILDPGLIPRHITPDHPNNLKAYKTSLGLSVYLGAGLLLPLNQYFSALIEPRLVYRLKPVTLESYPLKEHRHLAGLHLGLRYHFHQ